MYKKQNNPARVQLSYQINVKMEISTFARWQRRTFAHQKMHEAQAMLVPVVDEKVERQGRAGVFQVSRVDFVRQIADLHPLVSGYFEEHDVPFAVLSCPWWNRPFSSLYSSEY